MAKRPNDSDFDCPSCGPVRSFASVNSRLCNKCFSRDCLLATFQRAARERGDDEGAQNAAKENRGAKWGGIVIGSRRAK